MARHNTGMKGLYQQGEVWAIDAQFRGQRLRQSIGPDKAQAVDALRLWKSKVVEGAYFPTRSHSSVTVSAVLSAYWAEHLSLTKYGHIAQYYQDSIDRFFGGMRVAGLKKSDVDRYATWRGAQFNNQGKPISPVTIRAEIGSLLWALRHCALRSESCPIPVNPLAGYKRDARPDPKRIVLDDGTDFGKEWQAIHAKTCRADKGIILALYETGARPGELFAAKWSWIEEVSPDHWLLKIPAENEKTGRGREIPVSTCLLAHLKTLLRTSEDTLIFPNHSGEQRQDIRGAFAGAVERANLTGRGYTPYCLRRTRITVWDSIDPAAGRMAAGHSPIDTHARHYVRISRARLFKLVGIELQIRTEYRIAAVG